MKATKHWWSQRLTAILLIPLSYWLVVFLQYCVQKNFFETIEWLTLPLNKIALCAWTITVFYHAALGIQVVLEDYVSTKQKRFVAISTVNTIAAGLALSSIVLLFSNN
jgi:succinate dehydrogenase / fumarate reductase membrane anchor subunit